MSRFLSEESRDPTRHRSSLGFVSIFSLDPLAPCDLTVLSKFLSVESLTRLGYSIGHIFIFGGVSCFIRFRSLRRCPLFRRSITQLWPSALSNVFRLNLLTRHHVMYTASSFGVDSFISIESLDPLRLWPSALSPLLWLNIPTRSCPIDLSFRLCLLPRHGFGFRRCLINFLWSLLTRRSFTARRRLTSPFHSVAYFDPNWLLLSALSHRPFLSLDP
jgi:hypothetical protein